MSGVVVFSAVKFLAQYPEMHNAQSGFTWFAEALNQNALLENWFRQAEMLLNNTPCSVVKNLDERETLLFLLVRHFAELHHRAVQGGLVGRISSATEGSVSVSAEMPASSAGAAWYNQTPFGASFWQLTSRYRRFRYVRGQQYAGRW